MPIHRGDLDKRDYENANSIRPFKLSLTLGADFQIDEDINALAFNSQKIRRFRFRAINCILLDPTTAGMIEYVDNYGRERVYYAHFSGIHPINGRGILTNPVGIDTATFQVLI